MILKILIFIAILGNIYRFFYLARDGIKSLKETYKETKKAFKETKKVKIEDKGLLWAFILVGVLVITAILCLIFFPMSELESLGLVIVMVGTWIVIALEKK